MSDSLTNAKRLWLLMRPERSRVHRITAVGTAIGLIALVPPLILQRLFDDVYPRGDESLLLMILLGALCLNVANVALGWSRGYLTRLVGTNLYSELAQRFSAHLQSLPLDFFDTAHSGEIASRLAGVQRALQFMIDAGRTLLVSSVHILIVPVLLLRLDRTLAALALAGLPLTLYLTRHFSVRLRALSRASQERNAASSAFLNESLANAKLIRSLGAQRDVHDRHAALVAEAADAQVRSGMAGTNLEASTSLIRVITMSAYTYVAWRHILDGSMSLGGYMAFSMYLGYLTGPVERLLSLYVEFNECSVSIARYFEYLDIPPDDAPDTASVPMLASHRQPRSIALAGVSVCRGGTLVLADVNMTIGEGTLTALVGPSGSGKSTLVGLLHQLWPRSSGSIHVGGIDIDAYPPGLLRTHVALVQQGNVALRGTIRSNLLLGAGAATDAALLHALDIAQMADFVADLRLGLDTIVGETGLTLSGGQLQRLAIARAIVKDAGILILDEATSSLDEETEARLLDRLIRRADRRTIVLVTHRVRTARAAELVYTVGDGTVTEGLSQTVLLDDHDAYAVRLSPSAHPVA